MRDINPVEQLVLLVTFRTAVLYSNSKSYINVRSSKRSSSILIIDVFDHHLYLNVDMSNPPIGKQSKKSRLLRSFEYLFSRRSWSLSHPRAQSVTANSNISASPTNSVRPESQVNPQGSEYTAILELSGPLTWEHRMKEWRSTAYEGLKTAIQGIYDCSVSFPPLQATAGVLLMISKVVDVRGSMCSMCKYIINVSFCPSESFSKQDGS